MTISISKIIKELLPDWHINRFILKYLEKIAHQDELNQLFAEGKGLKNLDFMEHIFRFFSLTFTLNGEENLPPNDGKKYVFVSNHPMGGIEGVILGYILGKRYGGKVKILANSVLMYVEPLSEMFVSVNILGSSGINSIKNVIELYHSDNQIFLFPSGSVARKRKGKIYDSEWKKSFITAAVKERRDIVPFFFDGRNSGFFYNLSNFRKFLGIKHNVEMLYFSDELFKQRGRHFSITAGKAIPCTAFDKIKTAAQWAEWVKEQVYKLQQP
jgi:putative hemolysin